MKTTFSFFILLIFSNLCNSQDIIRKKNGSIINAEISQITSKEIEYKIKSEDETYIFSIPIEEVSSIEYEDGIIKIFDNQPEQKDEIKEVSNETTPEQTKKEENITISTLNTPKSQPKLSKEVQDDLNKQARKSLTLVLFESIDENYNQDIFYGFKDNCISRNNEFDYNLIKNWFLRDADQDYVPKTDWIKQTLINNKIANKVLDGVLNDGNGNWSMDKLIEKARYNLSDLEVESLKATFGGVNAGVKKAPEIEKILNEFYIMAFRYSNIMTMDTYYDKMDRINYENATKYNLKYIPVNRFRKGFVANRTTMFYKIIMDEPTLNIFYSKLFNNRDSRDSMVYSLKYEDGFDEIIKATQPEPLPKLLIPKTRKDFFNDLTSTDITQYESGFKSFFESKSSIYSTKPLLIKLGRKEGLKIDQRFFVYELIQKGDVIVEKRVGVIRATRKITDNRYNATGSMKPSKFYKVGGTTPLDKGMIVKKSEDIGISIYLGSSAANKNFHNYFNARTSLNLSSILSISQLRIEAGYWYSKATAFDKNYLHQEHIGTIVPESNDLIIQEVGLGIRKDIFLKSYFQISPYVGYNLGFINYIDTNMNALAFNAMNIETDNPYHDKIIFSGLALGLDLGINLTYNFKLIGSLNYIPNRTFDINNKIKYYDSNGNFNHFGSSDKPYFNKFDAKLLTSFGFRFDF